MARPWRSLRWEATTLALAPSPGQLAQDGTQQLRPVVSTSLGIPVNSANAPVTYMSSDEEVATVSATGLVTAIADGEAVVTGTVDNKTTPTITGTVTVTVLDIVPDSVVVTPATVDLLPTATQQLTAVVKNDEDTTLVGAVVTWESDDEDVATVSASGLVTSVGDGEATITATAAEGVTDTCVVTVDTEPASVVTTPATAELEVPATQQLVSVVKNAADQTLVGAVVTYESDEEGFATVDAAGLVTSVAEGEATITATAALGVTDTCVVTVTEPA